MLAKGRSVEVERWMRVRERRASVRVRPINSVKAESAVSEASEAANARSVSTAWAAEDATLSMLLCMCV